MFLFFFKIMHNMVPGYLQELKPEKQKQGRYMFRNKNDLAEPNWRITKYRSPFCPLPFHFGTNWRKQQELLQIMSFLKIL